ncbi:hypothetical protein FQN54_006121 [Arachnomyces sp. PD_36]|nr:hypothetical protein FQN54_006121 [Arachnomyces sp. PD_36]
MKVTGAFLSLIASTQACFFIAHSSEVGDFEVSHSEPSDHGGEPQYVSWSNGGCTIEGELFDGCEVSVSSADGCGDLSFEVIPDH